MRDKRIVKVGLVVVTVAVVLVGLFAFTRGSPVRSSEEGTTVDLAFIEVAVASPEPTLESPDVFVGVPATSPNFDTSDLGPNLTFEMRPTETLEPLDPTVARVAVYLGHDVDGEPYYVFRSGSDGIVDYVGQIIADLGSVGRFMTTYGTLMTGPSIFDDPEPQPFGFPTGLISSVTGQPIDLVAEWHSLPDEVSVVVFYNGDEPLGWQTPVSGSVGLATTLTSDQVENDDTSMVALDLDGTVVETVTLFPAQALPRAFEPSTDTTNP